MTTPPSEASVLSSTANSKKRIVEIDTMRGIAIILMVLGHSFLVYPIDIFHLPGYYEFHRWFYTFHMGMLFVVAGAVYSCKDYKTFITKKIHRILVPYVIFDVISVLSRSFGGLFVNNHANLPKAAFYFFFYGGDYWFLYTIFVIFLIYPLLEKFFNEPWKEVALLLALFVVADYSHLHYFRISNAASYLTVFIVGKYAVKRIDTLRPSSHSKSLLIIIAMSAIWAVTNYYYKHVLPTTILNFFRIMSMSVVTFIFASYLSKWASKGNKISQKAQDILALCSKYSLQIYLFDAFWMVLIRSVIINIFHLSHPIAILFFMTTINIASTLLLCIFVLQKNKWVAWLTGLRSSLK